MEDSRRVIRKKKFDLRIVYYIMVILMIIPTVYKIISAGNMYMYIDIGADTYSQYWPTLEAAIRWWKSSQKELWDLHIGLGEPYLATSGSTLFDPFVIIAFPFRSAGYATIWILVVKLLVLSIISYKLYNELHLKDSTLLIAALTHTFCGFMVGWGQHYWFGSLFVFYTLLLYSYERYMNTGKWRLMSLCIGLIGLMSAYILYMVLLFLAFWAVGRYGQLSGNKTWKGFILYVVRLFCIVLLGIMISLPIFLQQVGSLLNNPRVGGNSNLINFQFIDIEQLLQLFYRSLSNCFMGINQMAYDSNFYESGITYVGIVFYFGLAGYIYYVISQRKKIESIMLLAIVFAVIFPNTVNVIFNGLSANTPRWYFLLVPLLTLMTSKGIERIRHLSNQKKYSLVFLSSNALFFFLIYYANMILPKFGNDSVQRDILYIVSICVCIYTLLIGIDNKKLHRIISLALIITIGIEMSVNMYITTTKRSMVPNKVHDEQVYQGTDYFDGAKEVVDRIRKTDDSLFRVAKTYNQVDLCAPIMQNYYGETYYTSFCSSDFSQFIKENSLRIIQSSYFYGFDERVDLRNLYGAKYILSKRELNWFGYELYGKDNNIFIYQNKNQVGFGTNYSQYMTYAEYDKLPVDEKAKSLYDVCIINDDSDAALELNHETDSTWQGYREYDSDYSIVLDAENSVLWIELDEESTSSIDVSFKNRNPGGVTIGEITTQDAEENELSSFSIWINSAEQCCTVIDYGVKKIGLHANVDILKSIEDINIYKVNDQLIADRTQSLRKNGLKISECTDSRIVGETDVESTQMMLFPINYDSDWEAYVDGKKVPIERVNTTFIGILIPKGRHNVEIKYFPHQLYFSSAASLVAILICLLSLIWNRMRIRRRRNAKD